MYRLIPTATALAVTTFASISAATITLDIGISTNGSSVANALNTTTTEGWAGAQLFVELTQGSVVNLDPLAGGVDAAPSQALIDAIPALLFDTYYGRVGELNRDMGSAFELGGGSVQQLGPSSISAAWFADVSATAINNVSIGNFVFSDDAEGTWALGVFERGFNQVIMDGGTLVNGEMVTALLPGDLNADGFVGLSDLDTVLDNWNLNVPPGDPLADPSGDGFVGLDDLDIILNYWNNGMPTSPWILGGEFQAGDINGDGFVGIDDLNDLLSNWYQAVPPGDPAADLSNDGFIGLDDQVILESYWHTGTPPIAVPEPASLILLAGGLAVLNRRRG